MALSMNIQARLSGRVENVCWPEAPQNVCEQRHEHHHGQQHEKHGTTKVDKRLSLHISIERARPRSRIAIVGLCRLYGKTNSWSKLLVSNNRLCIKMIILYFSSQINDQGNRIDKWRVGATACKYIKKQVIMTIHKTSKKVHRDTVSWYKKNRTVLNKSVWVATR